MIAVQAVYAFGNELLVQIEDQNVLFSNLKFFL